MKLVPLHRFGKQIKKVSNNKLVARYNLTGRNMDLKSYHEVIATEMRERGII